MAVAKPSEPKGQAAECPEPEEARGLDPARGEVPNALTRKTIVDAEAGKGIVECVDAEDFFRKLGL